MTDEIIKCYWCEKIVELRSKGKQQKVESVHGMVWEFGYSYGGWGHRNDFTKGHGEVCDECFKIYEEQVNNFIKLFKNRKGINKPTLQILNTDNLQLNKKSFLKRLFKIQ